MIRGFVNASFTTAGFTTAGFTTPGFSTPGFSTPSFSAAGKFTDTTRTLGAIKDPGDAGLAGADPKAPALTPAAAGDATVAGSGLRVLRGVGHADTQLPGELFKSPGGTNDGQREYQNLGSLGDADIMAVAFIVMMEATRSAQEDLKSIMDGVKSINHAKSEIRAELDELKPYPPK
jgi:hypothetical protein